MSPVDVAIAALFPIISQVLYPGVGDIDDCAIIATFRAARQAGYRGPLPTVTAFRAAAGKPDRPGPTGLFNDDVWRGVTRTVLDSLDGVKYQGSWAGFRAYLEDGWSASVAVDSARLPAKYRFGFLAGHRVGADMRDGRFYLSNPLAPDGSEPQQIAEADLREAALVIGGGVVLAVLFPPQEDSAVHIANATNQAGLYRVAKGAVIRVVDPATFEVTETWRPTGPTSGRYDQVVHLGGDAPTGNFIRVANGPRAGKYVERVAGVDLEADVDPTAAALAAANKKLAAARPQADELVKTLR